MAKYGYIRVSTHEQKEDRQLISMQGLEIPQSHIFIDKQSGKNTKRPELQRLLSVVEKGDSITVEAISRFARNTRDLLSLIDILNEKGVEFISLKENIDTTTPTGKFMLTILGAVAELEREYILQRQAEGIAAAKLRKVQFGRKRKKAPDNFNELMEKWEKKIIEFSELLRLCGMSKSTFYRRWSEYKTIAETKKVSQSVHYEKYSA